MCKVKEMADLAGGLHQEKVDVAGQAPKESRTKGLQSEILVMEKFPLFRHGKRVVGALFYVHHDYFLKSLNEELDHGGFRPATTDELTEFSEAYCGSCETLSWSRIIATHPDSIKDLNKALEEVYGIKGVTLIPAICIEDGKPAEPRVIEHKGERDCDVYFSGHAGTLVLAIKKEA